MNNKTITRAVSNTSLMLKSPQKNLQCLIKHYGLKDVENYFFTSDAEYYLNAKIFFGLSGDIIKILMAEDSQIYLKYYLKT